VTNGKEINIYAADTKESALLAVAAEAVSGIMPHNQIILGKGKELLSIREI
jgi:hypothetical protein